MRYKYLRQMLLLVIALLVAQAMVLASDKDFKGAVKSVESHYHAKRRKIPFLGVAGFLVKVIKPAGVKEFKLAVFDNQNFSPGPQDAGFATEVQNSIGRKWQPLVRSNSRLSGNRAYIYSQKDGKDFKLLSVT